MAAQTFTVRNNGTQAYNLTGIQFNTPLGISHVADLSNLFPGAPTGFTSAIYSGTSNLPPATSKTFTVDHFYVSGAASSTPREGSIIITAEGNRSATITTNIRVSSAATPTYTLFRSASEVNEGQSFTINLSTTNVPNGTTVAYNIAGVSSADINGASLNGTFTVNNNSASATFQTTADQAETADETFTLSLVNVPGTSISVIIRNTSPAPGPTPPPVTPPPVTPPPVTPPPTLNTTFTLSASPQASGEGDPAGIAITLTGSNVPQSLVGQSFNWKVVDKNGTVRAANPSAVPEIFPDFAGTIQNGELIGTATLTVPTTVIRIYSLDNKVQLDTTRTFRFSIPNTLGGVSVTPVDFYINEKGAALPLYQINNAPSSVNEGSNYTFTIEDTAKRITNGSSIGYTIEGVGTYPANSADFGFNGAMTSSTIFNNYQAQVSIPIVSDGWNNGQWYEADEKFTVKLTAYPEINTGNVTINNTSKPNFVINRLTNYTSNGGTIIASPSSCNEGDTIYLRFEDTSGVTNIDLNNQYHGIFKFEIFGLSSKDAYSVAAGWNFVNISGYTALVSPPFTLDTNRAYETEITALRDHLTETYPGVESWYIRVVQVSPTPNRLPGTPGIPGNELYVIRLDVNDTSLTPTFSTPVVQPYGWGVQPWYNNYLDPVQIDWISIRDMLGLVYGTTTINIYIYSTNIPDSLTANLRVTISQGSYGLPNSVDINGLSETTYQVSISNNQGSVQVVLNNINTAGPSYSRVDFGISSETSGSEVFYSLGIYTPSYTAPPPPDGGVGGYGGGGGGSPPPSTGGY